MRAAVFALGLAAGAGLQPAAQVATTHMAPLVERAMQTRAVGALPVKSVCVPMAVNIYFSDNDPALNRAALTTLDVLSARMRGCAIEAVAIEATTDDIATPKGRKLAGLRGAALLKELSARGLAPDSVIISEQQNGEPASADPAPDHVRLSIAAQAVMERDANAIAGAPTIANNEI